MKRKALHSLVTQKKSRTLSLPRAICTLRMVIICLARAAKIVLQLVFD